MPKQQTIYEVHYEFQTVEQIKDRTAGSTKIHFRAATDAKAVVAARSFWNNRYKNMPEYFAKCCCAQIWEFDPKPLDEDGGLQGTGRCRMVFEWKIQTGLGPGVCVGAALVASPMADMFNSSL